MEIFIMCDQDVKVSIIIPCYNAENKLDRCVESLKNIDFPEHNFEVIFIDDGSIDNSVFILENETNLYSHWHIIKLNKNSGSPSKPRNIGLKSAKGTYIFFLDIDDEIISSAIKEQYALASSKNASIIRGSLIMDDGDKTLIMNSISDFSNVSSKSEKILSFIKNQSTTVPSFIKKSILINNKIVWNETIKMGEDTIFFIDVLKASSNIIYMDKPLFIYHKSHTGEASSTQIYGSRELSNHLYVWNYAEKNLEKFNFSFFEKRGQVALQTVLQAIKNYYQGDIDKELFEKFSDFINKNWNTIKDFKYSTELKNMLQLIKDNDYYDFFDFIKPKLLIAGHDLKFISNMIPEFKATYQVKIDQWSGHETHDEAKSNELLIWADVIFCEWLFGNAVWYSLHKLNHQKLIIRLHRVELTRNYGHQINPLNVDFFCTVGVYTFEKMINTFNIDRNKARLIPNFIDTKNYKTSKHSDKVYNLGIVGILPARKGYLNALQILNQLKTKDQRYNLSIFGKMPHELSWVAKDKDEMDYFNQCEQYIKENNLESYINVKGWVDTQIALKDIGFILSVSNTDTLPESFHIAPGEGFASGNQAVFLHWDGVEYLYPKNYIFNSLNKIVSYIYDNIAIQKFNDNRKCGINFVQKNYTTNKLLNFLKSI